MTRNKILRISIRTILIIGYFGLLYLFIDKTLWKSFTKEIYKTALLYTGFFMISLPIFTWLYFLVGGLFNDEFNIFEMADLENDDLYTGMWMIESDSLDNIVESYNKCFTGTSGMNKDFNKGYMDAIQDFLNESSIKYKVGDEGLVIEGPELTCYIKNMVEETEEGEKNE